MGLLTPPGKNGASSVTDAWKGQVVVCIATGGSLTLGQVAAVRASGARVIAINDAYLWADFADVCYFADQKWRRWHDAGVDRSAIGMSAEEVRRRWAEFRGQKCTINVGILQNEVGALHVLRKSHSQGLSTEPDAICTGSNSGYQALNIALLAQPARIVMLGYDGKIVNGKAHFFGEHVDRSKPPFPTMKMRFVEMVGAMKRLGIETPIVNASPDSVFDMFEGGNLAASLQPAPAAGVVPA